MNIRPFTARVAAAIGLVVGTVSGAAAQEHPARRVATIVKVMVVEYSRGVDARGRLISAEEYKEATDYLADARASAARLPKEQSAALVLLDSIIAAVNAKRPPAVVDSLGRRFAQSLGTDATLELPGAALDPAAGRRVYDASCSSCHGPRGMGDGPAAARMTPRPAAIGSDVAMRSTSPATIYDKISVGVIGTPMAGFAAALSPTDRWNVVAFLMELQHASAQPTLGEGLYMQNCASCHGANGTGDGMMASSLSKLPPELGLLAWQAQRSDSQLAAAVRVGVPGSPMPPMPALTVTQERAMVAYLRTMATRDGRGAAASDSADPQAAATQSLSLLEQSLMAVRSGRRAEAVDRAVDAYVAFEPVETRSRPKNPGLVSTMEQLYSRFKSAVAANDIGAAAREQAGIEGNMPAVLALTRPPGSGAEAFWESFLIILREGVEAILVIGAVVTLLLKTGHKERLRSIWMGVALALVASAVTAVLLKTILEAIPASREIIEGTTLLLAVVVLFSVSYWLISRIEAAKWQRFIQEKVTVALDHGGGRALAVVAFLAVYREGAETALLYQALFRAGGNVALPLGLGIVAGAVALVVIFTAFYRFGTRIPLRPFFTVTSVLLYYMALVFVGKGVRELQEGDKIPATFIHFPTVDWLGLYPTWQTLAAQFALLALFLFMVAKTFWPRRSVTLPTVQPAAAPPADVDALRARIEALERRLGDTSSGR